jgi:hypothetical protein
MARTCWLLSIALCVLGLARQAAAALDPVRTGTSLGTRDTKTVRVVLLDAPPALARALRTALGPWGLQLESRSRQKPESSLPAAASSAQRLAGELDAQALVWLSSDGHGAALWLYEAARDSVRVRTFPDRALDDALAAALALSVKTWLRSADGGPELAGASSAAQPPLSAGGSAFAAAPEPDPTVAESSTERTRAAPPARARLLVHAAARAGALRPAAMEGRYGLELRAAVWRDAARSLWLAAQVDAGEPQAVRQVALRGDYRHWGAGLSFGIGQRLAATWFAHLLAGVVFERATLSGTLLPEGSAIERSRWQPLVQLRPELELALAPVGFLLQPALCAAPRQQRYLVDGAVVLSSRAVGWSLGGAVSVNLF